MVEMKHLLPLLILSGCSTMPAIYDPVAMRDAIEQTMIEEIGAISEKLASDPAFLQEVLRRYQTIGVRQADPFKPLPGDERTTW